MRVSCRAATATATVHGEMSAKGRRNYRPQDNLAHCRLTANQGGGPLIRVAVIGVGRWGANYVRVLSSFPDVKEILCADADGDRARVLAAQYGKARASDIDDAVTRADCIIIATPPSQHVPIATAAAASRPLLIEKPVASSWADLRWLESQRGVRLIQGGYLMNWHPAFQRLEELVGRGGIGDILYMRSERTNLGVVRGDIDIVADLAPHDLGMMMRLASNEVTACIPLAHAGGRTNAALIHTSGLSDASGTVYLSWLEPYKVRRFTVVGTDAMVIFDDMEPTYKLRVIRPTKSQINGSSDLYYAFGDSWAPQLAPEEPLRNQCRAFLDGARSGRFDRNDLDFTLLVERQVLRAREMMSSELVQASF